MNGCPRLLSTSAADEWMFTFIKYRSSEADEWMFLFM